jgi:hypothetical protein
MQEAPKGYTPALGRNAAARLRATDPYVTVCSATIGSS